MSKRNGLAFLDLDKLSVQEMTSKSLQIFVKHSEKQKDTTGRKVEFDSPCQIYAVLFIVRQQDFSDYRNYVKSFTHKSHKLQKAAQFQVSKQPERVNLAHPTHALLFVASTYASKCFMMFHSWTWTTSMAQTLPLFPFLSKLGGWVAHVSTTRHSITYLGSTPEEGTVRKESYCK